MQLHDAAQIALERQARGVALTPEEVALVTEHVPGCVVCSTFARTRTDTEALMTGTAQLSASTLDIHRITSAARDAIARQRRGIIRGLVGLATIVAACIALSLWTGDGGFIAPALGLVVLGVYAMMFDSARLALSKQWAARAEHVGALDTTELVRERNLARIKAILAMIGLLLAHVLSGALWLTMVPLLLTLHWGSVARILGREVAALRA